MKSEIVLASLLAAASTGAAHAAEAWEVRDAESGQVLLDARAIAGASAADGAVVVDVRPSAFERLVAGPDLVGRSLEVRVDGAVKTRATLQVREALARFRIEEKSPAAARALAEQLQALSPCVPVEPGRSLGRFSLGGKPAGPTEPAGIPGWLRATGKDAGVRLRVEGEVITEVEAPLPACARLKDRVVEGDDPRVLAAALGTCGPVERLEGGSRIQCEGARLHFAGPAAGPTLRVLKQPGAASTCATYVDSGGRYDATGAHPAAPPIVVNVAANGPVCAEGAAVAVSTKTRVADLEPLGCRVDVRRGGTHVVCPYATYSFAGPTLALESVTIEVQGPE